MKTLGLSWRMAEKRMRRKTGNLFGFPVFSAMAST